MSEEVMVTIHRRTPEHGHLTAEMSIEGAVWFADSEIAMGRAVILEIGAESLVVRVGREIRDFISRVLGGRKEPKPTLTTITPMAGGEIDPPPIPDIPMPPPRRYDGAQAEAPRYGGTLAREVTVYRSAPEADIRAWGALVERIGERSARGMLVGGGYAVRSALWPYILYIVTPDIIKIVNQGMQVGRICIVAQDGGSIWDGVLNRIQLLEGGVDGEVQVYATGQLIVG